MVTEKQWLISIELLMIVSKERRGNLKFKVIDDRKLATEIREKIKANGGYCPCKLEKTEDTKCICKDFLEHGVGKCHCGLYIKESE